uniref:Uncharacterized protein n=1 Tax=Eutreptiella gymnastica TaxID=73025 RepID=A0A7S1HXK7_9EUGL|mmetsp:Transcript_112195/g.194815  ORF Transcript_112195/g.194815 Transcript_112195/m.194815 type:complete len:121 (+) Transcript_112195:78-440(+)
MHANITILRDTAVIIYVAFDQADYTVTYFYNSDTTISVNTLSEGGNLNGDKVADHCEINVQHVSAFAGTSASNLPGYCFLHTGAEVVVDIEASLEASLDMDFDKVEGATGLNSTQMRPST